MISDGYKVATSIGEVEAADIDVVSLFHVLEHLIDPVAVLSEIRSKMSESGKLIIEVPHAKDFLISFLENEPFKAFTFWSEHLVLHTRESLNALLKAAGFNNISIRGCQRYPMANHLHWLINEKPGGHAKWSELRTEELDTAYKNVLVGLDCTDTLIATATL